MLDYINEAFKALDLLTEDVFATDSESIKELSDFKTSDIDDEEISIIDMEADTEDELEDSYVGKIICDCNVCHSHVFKNKEEITIDDQGVVDIEDDCPYCGEANGFVIIGEITEFNPSSTSESEPTEAEPINDEQIEHSADESLKEESNMDKLRRAFPELNEAFNNVSIETEDQKMTMESDPDGKVVVTTEPIAASTEGDAVISPLSDEAQDEIINAAASEEAPIEEPAEEIPSEESDIEDSMDFDIEEVDDESMDELGESYLKRVYENVESFKTSSAMTTSNQLIIEGLITFKSGATKKTGFIFEAKDATRSGKLRFIGENAHLSRGKKSFTLVGNVDNNKLIVESLTYNYRAKNADGASTRVYGTVNRSK